MTNKRIVIDCNFCEYLFVLEEKNTKIFKVKREFGMESMRYYRCPICLKRNIIPYYSFDCAEEKNTSYKDQ